jgi:hypothetical protein
MICQYPIETKDKAILGGVIPLKGKLILLENQI